MNSYTSFHPDLIHKYSKVKAEAKQLENQEKLHQLVHALAPTMSPAALAKTFIQGVKYYDIDLDCVASAMSYCKTPNWSLMKSFIKSDTSILPLFLREFLKKGPGYIFDYDQVFSSDIQQLSETKKDIDLKFDTMSIAPSFTPANKNTSTEFNQAMNLVMHEVDKKLQDLEISILSRDAMMSEHQTKMKELSRERSKLLEDKIQLQNTYHAFSKAALKLF